MSSQKSAICNLKSKIVVGLVGGIGRGKSSVAAAFAERGARVVSGDRAGHEALRQQEIRQRVVERFGPGVLDAQGQIDRRRLGAIVFADAGERQALEAIVFPFIEQRLREEITAARADPQVALIVLDAAIMIEAGWNRICDKLILVDAPRPLRLRRLAAQRGWSAKEVEIRERAQMPVEEKAKRADHVIDNSGAPEHVAAQVDDLVRQWRSKQ